MHMYIYIYRYAYTYLCLETCYLVNWLFFFGLRTGEDAPAALPDVDDEAPPAVWLR